MSERSEKMKKFPDTWVMPSNWVYDTINIIISNIAHGRPGLTEWKKEVLKEVDKFMEEFSIDIKEVDKHG